MRGKGSERNDEGGRPSSISMKASLKQDANGAARNSRSRSRVHIPSTLESLGTLCNDAASNNISTKRKFFVDKKRQARDISSHGGNHSTKDAVAVVSPPSTPEDDRNKTPSKQQSLIIDSSSKQIDLPCTDIDDFSVGEKVIELLDDDDDEASENEQPNKQQASFSDDDSSILEVYSICSGESVIDISDDDDDDNDITGETIPDIGSKSFLGKEKPPTKDNNNLQKNRASEETNYCRNNNKFPKADTDAESKTSPSTDITMQPTDTDSYSDADNDDAYYSSEEEETAITSVHRSIKNKSKYQKEKKPINPNKKKYSPRRSSWKTKTNKSEKEIEYSDEEENVTTRSHWSMKDKLKHHQEKKLNCSDEEESVTTMRYRTIKDNSKRNQEKKSGYLDSDSATNTQRSMKREKKYQLKKQSGCSSDEQDATTTSYHSRRSRLKRRKQDEKDSGCSSSDSDDYKPCASSSSDDNMASVHRKRPRNNRRPPKKNEFSDDDDDYKPSGKKSEGKRNEHVDSSEEDTAMINYMPSPYEQFRNEKVRRNQEYLASLGLFKIKEDLIGPSSSWKNRKKQAINESSTLSSKEAALEDAKSSQKERRNTKPSCQNSICDSLAAIGCDSSKKAVNTKQTSKGGNDNTAPWRSEVKESLLHINEVQQEIRKEQNSCFFYARSGELNKSYLKLKNTKKSMYDGLEKSISSAAEPDESLDYINDHYERGISQKKLNAKRGAVGKLQRCMQCVACLRLDDCLQCTYCRARNDPNKKNSRKCALRRCVAPLPPLIHKDDDKEESLEVCRNILSTKRSSLFGEALLKTDVKSLFGNQNLSVYRLLPPGAVSDGTSTEISQQRNIVIEHPMPQVRVPLSLDPDEQSLSDGIVLEDIEENDSNYIPVEEISKPLLQDKVQYPYEQEAINRKTLVKKVENGFSFERYFRSGEINKPFVQCKAKCNGKLVNDAEQHVSPTTCFASIDEIDRPIFQNKTKSHCEQQIIDQESLQPKNRPPFYDGKYMPRNKTGADFARGLLSFQRSLLRTEIEDEDFPEEDTYNLLVV